MSASTGRTTCRCPRCCPGRAETAAEQPDLAEPLALVAAALAINAESGCGCNNSAGPPPPSRWRTACSTATPGWCRSTRSVASPNVSASAPQNSTSAPRPGPLWPHAMTTLSTHDTKRGEDVRARIGVLSQVPSLWAELVGKWAQHAPAGPRDRTLLVAERLRRMAGRRRGDRRAARAPACLRREGDPGGRQHTTWNEPDTEFESAVHTWLDEVFDGPVAAELTVLSPDWTSTHAATRWARSSSS